MKTKFEKCLHTCMLTLYDKLQRRISPPFNSLTYSYEYVSISQIVTK